MATKSKKPRNSKREFKDKETPKRVGSKGVQDKVTDKYNDASWYTRNSQLALDAGRLSFNWPTGARVEFGIPTPTNVNGTNGSHMRFPGVWALDFVPAYGVTTQASDPLNISMFNIYSYVRHANSGHANYDAPDLMLYLMAMDNIYMFYQNMVRAYGMIRLFAQKNRNIPELAMKAVGFDYQDLLYRISDFRNYINTCAVRIGSMCVPATMPLFIRHMWMCSGLYADAPSLKSQFYVFKPGWFGKYNEKTSEHGGYLEGITFNNVYTLAEIMTKFDDMMSAVIESEDCNIMSGDILKAYGDGNLMKMSMISDDYSVTPVYNPEVLRQIQNATLIQNVGLPNYNNTPVLLNQDPDLGILKSTLVLSDPATCIMGKRIMTGSSELPSPEEVLVNSRLMVASHSYSHSGTSADTSKVSFDQPIYGTEIIQNARLFDLDNIDGVRMHYATVSSAAPNYWILSRLARANFYNYHPMIGTEVQSWSNNALVNADWAFHFDVDDFAIVDAHDIEKMHNTALLSLLDVPQLGRVQ